MTNMARMEMLATVCIRFLVALVEKQEEAGRSTYYTCSGTHSTKEKGIGFFGVFLVVSFWC